MEYGKIKATWWSGTCYHLEQLNAIISSKDIKGYAYILHDKDKKENSEELKKPHYHFLVQFYTNMRGSWFKAFATDDLGIVLCEACYAPNGAFDYLIHNTPICKKENKHLYDESERISTFENFETDDNKKLSQTENFFKRLYKNATNIELQSEFPTLYAQYGVDKIEKFRQDKFKADFGENFRDIKVTYIYGGTRLGKTSYIYDRYKPNEVCRVTNYKIGTFENYRNQKVLVLDEFTGTPDITFMNNLLDRLPLELPARFTNRQACFTKVYIISNLPLNELYKDSPPQVRQAFLERFHEIIKFTALGKWQYEKRREDKAVQMELIPIENDEDLPF